MNENPEIRQIVFSDTTISGHCWCVICDFDIEPITWLYPDDHTGPHTLADVVEEWQIIHDFEGDCRHEIRWELDDDMICDLCTGEHLTAECPDGQRRIIECQTPLPRQREDGLRAAFQRLLRSLAPSRHNRD